MVQKSGVGITTKIERNRTWLHGIRWCWLKLFVFTSSWKNRNCRQRYFITCGYVPGTVLLRHYEAKQHSFTGCFRFCFYYGFLTKCQTLCHCYTCIILFNLYNSPLTQSCINWLKDWSLQRLRNCPWNSPREKNFYQVETRSIRNFSCDDCSLLAPHEVVAHHNLCPKSSCDRLNKIQLQSPYQQCLA